MSLLMRPHHILHVRTGYMYMTLRSHILHQKNKGPVVCLISLERNIMVLTMRIPDSTSSTLKSVDDCDCVVRCIYFCVESDW